MQTATHLSGPLLAFQVSWTEMAEQTGSLPLDLDGIITSLLSETQLLDHRLTSSEMIIA